MKTFISTNGIAPPASFREAMFRGMPADGGLYWPSHIPEISADAFAAFRSMSLQEVATFVASLLLTDDLSRADVERIVHAAINFDAPLVPIEDGVYALELFHGPTCAFKDFGARFMAQSFSHFVKERNKEITVLVATSGDTGSAVAHGFLGIEGVRVVILYPSGKVSAVQEQQLTTMGKNIVALEIDGTFDDCQRMVKSAFADPQLISAIDLTSANSINVARLIPQTFYYCHAIAKLDPSNGPITVSVPSGNYGNLTAGLIAKRMGVPVQRFVAATNANKVVPDYLESGQFTPLPSITTISNAMDVGNPSNFERMMALYDGALDAIQAHVVGSHHTDIETLEAIVDVYNEHTYVLDPHGAVAYIALKQEVERSNAPGQGIFLQTAHPGKFYDVLPPAIRGKVETPPRLKDCLGKQKQSIRMKSNLSELKDFLVSGI